MLRNRKAGGSKEVDGALEARLEVAALVVGVGRPAGGHLPVVPVAPVQQGHPEALHRLLLQSLELQQQRLL